MHANSPITRRDRLLELLRSRTQADPLWTEEELAVALCCSTRSVRRLRQWLRDSGMLPTAHEIGRSEATARIRGT